MISHGMHENASVKGRSTVRKKRFADSVTVLIHVADPADLKSMSVTDHRSG